MSLRCQQDFPVCGYKYDPQEGSPEHHIPPGTSLRELRNWACCRCVKEAETAAKAGGSGDNNE